MPGAISITRRSRPNCRTEALARARRPEEASPRLGSGRWASLLIAAGLWVGPVSSQGASTMDPAHAMIWSANAGWMNALADPQNGVVTSEMVCSGFLYSANVGWIQLGNGQPANGIRYQNNSATDYGVNIDNQGQLRGFGYGQNIGWVNFEEAGAPKIDLQTGQLSGYAYGANMGWIALSGPSFFLRTRSIDPGVDSNHNGLPDWWELQYAGNLNTLRADRDTDGDGQTDYEEYVAGTDPTNPQDNLSVRSFTIGTTTKAVLSWKANSLRQYQIERKDQLSPSAAWSAVTPLLKPSSSGLLQMEVELPPQPAQGFFRITARLLSFP